MPSPVRILDPLFRPWLNLIEGKVHMHGLFGDNLVILADETSRVDKFYSIQSLPAKVTLVASRILLSNSS